MKIGAGEFKAKCLKLMIQVQTFHEEIIITKFGKPVAKLVPVEDLPRKPLFGLLKEQATIQADIVKPTGESWSADA